MAKNNLFKNILLIGGIVIASAATIAIIRNLNKPGNEPSISVPVIPDEPSTSTSKTSFTIVDKPSGDGSMNWGPLY